ncbi:ABC transporter substrate-binding protein [Alsobacter sp. SYSU BS001988]
MKHFVLAAAAAVMWLAPHAVQAAPPAPYEPDQAMVEAAKKEGKVVWYTSTDVQVSEKMAKAFEAKYPGIDVQVERSGAERVYQRINQEYGSKIYNADVIETSDAVHFLVFKREGILAQAQPSDVAKNWPAEAKDPDGYYAAYRAHLSVIGYNTKQVKAEDAPKSHADLLLPKWKNRMVKAHPGYSGTVLTGTAALSKLLGWEYFEKLGQQKVMQVQSSTEPPKKLAQGERSIMADGNEYNLFLLRETGVPIEVVYAEEGSPIAIGHAGLLKNAAHPNAGKLFYAFMYTQEAQQLASDVGGLRSFHPGVKEKEGRVPLSKIKVLFTDPAEVEKQIETIKKKYEEYFGT